MEALRELWTAAGLEDIETRTIIAHRAFADFDEFWDINARASTVASIMAAMKIGEADRLKERVRRRLKPDAEGRIGYDARANAIKGRVPG